MRWIGSLILLAGCGGSVATVTDAGSTTPDAATSKDAAPSDASAPLSSFCQGSAPKMQENGKDNPILTVTGKAILMNCCNSAAVSITTAQHAAIFHLRWRQYGATSPVVLDTKQASVELALGCDPTTTTCTSGTSVDHYTDGFSGTISYEFLQSKMLVSYCVEVAETASDPHTVVHSMKLWLPNVESP